MTRGRHGTKGQRAKPGPYLPLLAVILALGACGGKNLNRQEFGARAEQTCHQSISEFAQLPDPKQVDLPGLARFAEQARKVTRRRKEQLKRATPTRDAAEEYGEFVVHVGDVEKHLEDLKEAARARNVQEAERYLLEVHQSGEKAESVARRLALEPCAQLAAGIAKKADTGPPARGSLSSPANAGADLTTALPPHPG